MKKALLLYSSSDGQTVKILRYIEDELANSYQCDLVNLNEIPAVNFAQYDKVLIGASVRYGHLNKKLYKFIENNLLALTSSNAAFFCVNLAARKPGKDTVEGSVYLKAFFKRSPWKPTLICVFAGALYYPRYRLLDRVMIRFIMKITGGETDTTKEVEYTDWTKVKDFSERFCSF